MYMKTAVAAALVAAASAFAPTSVGVAQPRLRSAVCDVSMQMDRRAARAAEAPLQSIQRVTAPAREP